MRGSPKLWLSRLKDANESVREKARRALCSLTPNDRRAVPDLIEALNSGDRSLGYWAARGLSGIGPAATDAVPALVLALQNDDSDIRFWAAVALGSVGPGASEAVPELISLLEDPAFGIRQAASDCLVRINPADDAIVTALIDRLRTEEDEAVREYVTRALGKAGTSAAVARLAAALEDHYVLVRREAAIGLKMLGPRAGQAIDAIRKALTRESDEIVRIQLEIALRRVEEACESPPPL